MKKKLMILIFTLLLISPIPFYMLTSFPSYTVTIDVNITVWAYSKQSKKTGRGYIEEINTVERFFSVFDSIYNMKNVWNTRIKYPYTENIETHHANFSIRTNLVSNSMELDWHSSELNINQPGTYLAINKNYFKNIRPGNYSLVIILYLDKKVEDRYNSKIIIP